MNLFGQIGRKLIRYQNPICNFEIAEVEFAGTNLCFITFTVVRALFMAVVLSRCLFSATAVIISHLHTVMVVHLHHTEIDKLFSLEPGRNEKSNQQQ